MSHIAVNLAYDHQVTGVLCNLASEVMLDFALCLEFGASSNTPIYIVSSFL